MNSVSMIAILLAKLSAFLCKLFKIGSGSSLPGRVALAISPKLLQQFASEIESNREAIKICVSGTNGKTTSTGIIKQILTEYTGDKNIVCNDMGANLYYGVCAAFVNATGDGRGKSLLIPTLKSSNYVLEVDEASLASVTELLKPEIVTVTNIYRDQLDRFGELATTQRLIREGISKAGHIKNGTLLPKLVLNADDHKVVELGEFINSEIIFYSVEYSQELLKTKLNIDHSHLIRDFDTPPPGIGVQLSSRGKSQLVSTLVPTRNVMVKGIVLEENFDYSVVKLQIRKQRDKALPVSTEVFDSIDSTDVRIALPGLYNVYNAVAAAATAYAMRVPLNYIKSGVENYKTNFGRAEIKLINGVKCQTFLIKNPTGASEVLKHLSRVDDARFLIIINDNYADGRDVSWLWDAEFEHLNQPQIVKNKIYTAGKRAYDMALRLKYAGIPADTIEPVPSIKKILNRALRDCKVKHQRLFILPTYTALLKLTRQPVFFLDSPHNHLPNS